MKIGLRVETRDVTTHTAQRKLRNLNLRLSRIRHDVGQHAERIKAAWVGVANGGEDPSLENLAAYLALRHEDLRELQDELSFFGLSSLGRCESHVKASLSAVHAAAARLAGGGNDAPSWPAEALFKGGFKTIQARASEIFGRTDAGKVRVMVTLPAAAAVDPDWCARLVDAGVACVRVNCAHDDPDTWVRMIRNVRRAARAVKRDVRVQMDLTGPRARTMNCCAAKGAKRARVGDQIFLSASIPTGATGARFEAASSLPEIPEALPVGGPVFFNDGKLGATVARRLPDGVLLDVTQAREKGERFRDDMGINVPGTALNLPALTARDLEHLDFVVAHADIVGCSFVQSAADMDAMHEAIAQRAGLRRGRRPLALVAKIETALAVRNLPDIIVHGAARASLAVMIARGDLAVELGPVRLAEIQEELLWVCEAAHVPLIWATQVLESLAKRGRPSRAELTDAAMSERAECVMLNKGPYIIEAARLLNEVLERMAGHQRKKMPVFRPLRSWEHLLAEPPPK